MRHPSLDSHPRPRRIRRPTASEIHEQRSRELEQEARVEIGRPGDEMLVQRAAEQVSLRDGKISQRELRRRATVHSRRARRSYRRLGRDEWRSLDGKTMAEEDESRARMIAYAFLYVFTVLAAGIGVGIWWYLG
jgi:hypothetical protein